MFFPVFAAFLLDLMDRQILVAAEGTFGLVIGAETDLPVGDALDVKEVPDGDIVGSEILATGSAGKGHGRSEAVVKASQCALRGWRVDHDAAGIQGLCKITDLLIVVGENAYSMSESSVFVDFPAHRNPLLEGGNFIEGKDRRQDLKRKRPL